MAEKTFGKVDNTELRRQAEKRHEKESGAAPPSGTGDDPQRLLHELQLHRIELEMQNAELCKSRDELEMALKKYTDLYDFAPVGYVTLDRAGTIRAVNLTASSLMGMDRSHLIGRCFTQVVSAETSSVFSVFLGKTFTNSSKETCEVVFRKEDSAALFVRLEGVTTAAGDECHVALIDITERKRTEEALTACEREFRTLVEDLPDNILRYDRECRVIYANPQMLKTLGRPASSLLRKTPLGSWENDQGIPVMGFEELANYQTTLQQVISSGESATVELHLPGLTGELLTHSIRIVAERDGAGAIIGALALGRDITESKQAEEALYRQAELETRLTKIAEISPGVIVSFHLTPEGWLRIPEASPKLAELTGYRPEDVVEDADMVFSTMHVDDIDQFIASICESAATLCPWRNEFRIVHPAKGEIWVEVDALPVQLEVGGTIWYGFLHDITERKRTEETIRQLNVDLSTTLQTIPDPMFEIDQNGTYLNVWAQNPHLLARQKELLLGHTVSEMLAPDAAEICMTAIREAVEKGCSYGNVIRLDLDVGTRWFELSISRKADVDGPSARFIVLSRDITERKQANEALLAKQQKLTDIAVALSLAEERERRRIAEELHDHIGQTLFLGKLKLGGLMNELPRIIERDELQPLMNLHEQVMRSVRSLTQQLSPPILSGSGLEAALDWLGKQMEEDYCLRVVFVDDRQPKPLTQDICAVMFQACRELLINVAKHAETETVRLEVGREGDLLRIMVEDQGVGFDLAGTAPGDLWGRGFGLLNIRERIRHLGGKVEIKSVLGKGTRVTLRVALEKEEVL